MDLGSASTMAVRKENPSKFGNAFVEGLVSDDDDDTFFLDVPMTATEKEADAAAAPPTPPASSSAGRDPRDRMYSDDSYGESIGGSVSSRGSGAGHDGDPEAPPPPRPEHRDSAVAVAELGDSAALSMLDTSVGPDGEEEERDEVADDGSKLVDMLDAMFRNSFKGLLEIDEAGLDCGTLPADYLVRDSTDEARLFEADDPLFHLNGDLPYHFDRSGALCSDDSGARIPEIPGSIYNAVMTATAAVVQLRMESLYSFECKRPRPRMIPIYMTSNWRSAEKLLLVLQTSGKLVPGVWSRSLLVDEGLRSGSMLPCFDSAMKKGYGVIVLNPNSCWQPSYSPSQHVVEVWDSYASLAAARHVFIMAHGYGGELVKQLLSERRDSAVPRLRAINIVESTHTIDGKEHVEVRRCLNRRVINWQMSSEGLGRELEDSTERLGCVCLSGGVMPPATSADGKEFNRAKAISLVMPAMFEFMEASLDGTIDSQAFVPFILRMSMKEYKAMAHQYATVMATRTVRRFTNAKLSEARVPWVPSQSVRACQRCEARFGFFLRKHHCRACGYVVCFRCSDFKAYLPGYNGVERVCEMCFQTTSSEAARRDLSGSPKPVVPSAKEFQMLKVLGQGHYGKVVMVRKRSNGRVYAMKIIKKGTINCEAERKILEEARHPFIAQLKYAFQSKSKLYYVMDFLRGGELFSLMQRVGPFAEDHARFYAAEIVSALRFLHNRDVAYRDLKPENILLDDKGHLCIVDFGLSKVGVGMHEGAKSFVGSPEYTAPELLQGKRYGKAADLWSFGMLIHEMLTGELPFYNTNRDILFKNILFAPLTIPAGLSKEAFSLLTGLLVRSPTDRLGSGGIAEVMRHPFFAGVDWPALERKEVNPPYTPSVSSATDTKNFDHEFTDLVLPLSPATKSKDSSNHYAGFSYADADEKGLSVINLPPSVAVIPHYGRL